MGIIVAAVGAVVVALLFVAFWNCMTHTHAVVKERAISYSQSRERVVRSSGESEEDYVHGNTTTDI